MDCSATLAGSHSESAVRGTMFRLERVRRQCPPLRARCSFQRLVGNRVGEDIFVRLVEVGGGVVHGIDPFAKRHPEHRILNPSPPQSKEPTTIGPRRSRSVCILTAAFVERKSAYGNSERHSSIVVLSSA